MRPPTDMGLRGELVTLRKARPKRTRNCGYSQAWTAIGWKTYRTNIVMESDARNVRAEPGWEGPKGCRLGVASVREVQ
jgi:hypothetical protein